MKFSVFISAIALSVLSLVSVNASAQTKQSVPCSWTSASVVSNPSGAVVTDQCLGSSGTVATRSRLYGTYGSYSCAISSSYSYDGSCESPSFYVYVTPSCGPNHFAAYNGGNAVFVGQNAPFPTAAVQNFCGACGFETRNVTPPSSYGTLPGGMYVITCK